MKLATADEYSVMSLVEKMYEPGADFFHREGIRQLTPEERIRLARTMAEAHRRCARVWQAKADALAEEEDP